MKQGKLLTGKRRFPTRQALEFNAQRSLAPFFPTPHPVVVRLLSLARLASNELLYDLGCGTGEILITAAKKFGAMVVGVELDKILFKEALHRVKLHQLEDRVKVIHGDLFRVNVRNADIVTLYLTEEANCKVRPKLEWELKHGARVVSEDFKIPGWEPSKVD